jgi:hypothetical protein
MVSLVSKMEPFGVVQPSGTRPAKGLVILVHGGAFSGGEASHNGPLAAALAMESGCDVCRLSISMKTPVGFKGAISDAVQGAVGAGYPAVYVWGVSSGSFYTWWALGLEGVAGVVAHCPVLDPAARIAAAPSPLIERSQLACFGSTDVMRVETDQVLDVGRGHWGGKPRVFYACAADKRSPVSVMSDVMTGPHVRVVWGGQALAPDADGHAMCTQWTLDELRACLGHLALLP